MQAALVPGGGVLVEHTLLHALIQSRNGFTVLLGNRGGIPFSNSLAQGAEGLANMTLVGAVDPGTLDCLTGALQRRHMICHGKPLAFLKLEAGGRSGPRPQTLSLRALTAVVNLFVDLAD